ncbi:MAG: PilN domain-containing protein [Armatimonadota bacterium]|nr:PilN domain-containing protein [Armatimonadota bacterium]MDR7447679.1 PilN domain-containing protein [Armatimonadota bacterium]MDR7459014.1 PilN domain-containing protein [Armatimonadota bacterium]MDR7480115.1 PilN domain-containing protein [Armatimonadota bacterium]MDR7489569.1 PilN domain-containing protein [Armatimonadota bacterium]
MIRINLLPRRPRRQVPGGALLAVALPVAVLVVLVVVYLSLSARLAALQGELRRADARIAELQPQVAEVQALKRQIEEARRKEDLLAQLLASQLPASSILANIRVLIPRDVWMTTLNVPDTGSFTIDGMAMSFVAVARLMDNLESSRLFDGLDLSSAERERVGEVEVVRFQVTGRLVKPGATPESSR